MIRCLADVRSRRRVLRQLHHKLYLHGAVRRSSQRRRLSSWRAGCLAAGVRVAPQLQSVAADQAVDAKVGYEQPIR